MVYRTSILILVSLVFPGLPALAQGQSWLTGDPSLADIDIDSVCLCSGESTKGSTTTKEEFLATYDWIEFETDKEAQTAWELFRTVNRCQATMVIGRLDDTGTISGRPGTCVLRDYKDWTPGINDAFIAAGIDRGAVFEAVSPPIGEIQLAPGGDMREHRRNVYNRELHLIEREGDYQIDGDIAAASPDNPVIFSRSAEWLLSLVFEGPFSGSPFPPLTFEVDGSNAVSATEAVDNGEMTVEGDVGQQQASLVFTLRGWDDDANAMVEVFQLDLDGAVAGEAMRGTFSGRMADLECAIKGIFDDESSTCGTLPAHGTWSAEQQ